MLDAVFGAEWFRTYVYGRPHTIDSDHMSLESITQKSLEDTPVQQQHMFYICKGMITFFAYHPGKDMAFPDTLSHFKAKPGPGIALDIAIHHGHLSPV